MDTSQGQAPVLRATARDVRMVSSLLRPIAFTSICQVTVSDAGLQIVTELNGVLQATAYIGVALFDKFTYTPDATDTILVDESDESIMPTTTFDVSLANWLACLNIYGTASGNMASASSERTSGFGGDADMPRGKAPFARGRTNVEMSYVGHGHALVLDITEAKAKTRCELSTFELNTAVISEMPYVAERTIGQAIMHSKDLTEALMSIDPTSRNVTFAFMDSMDTRGPPRTPTRSLYALSTGGGGGRAVVPLSSHAGDNTSFGADDDSLDTRAAFREQAGTEMLRISAVGDTGSTELDFPNRNKVFESFSLQYPSEQTYAYVNIQHCLRALQTSLKSSIRIDDQGMMSLQCLFAVRPVVDRAGGVPGEVDERSGPERGGFVEIRLLSVLTDDDL